MGPQESQRKLDEPEAFRATSSSNRAEPRDVEDEEDLQASKHQRRVKLHLGCWKGWQHVARMSSFISYRVLLHLVPVDVAEEHELLCRSWQLVRPLRRIGHEQILSVRLIAIFFCDSRW